MTEEKEKDKESKSYIEEGEFDKNGWLVLGRRIYDDSTYEFVGELDEWEMYLKTYDDATWREMIGS